MFSIPSAPKLHQNQERRRDFEDHALIGLSLLSGFDRTEFLSYDVL